MGRREVKTGYLAGGARIVLKQEQRKSGNPGCERKPRQLRQTWQPRQLRQTWQPQQLRQIRQPRQIRQLRQTRQAFDWKEAGKMRLRNIYIKQGIDL